MSTLARRRTLGAAALSSYATAVLADGPVSYWRLDEPSGTTAADQMANNPGTYSATGVTLGATGATTDGDKAITLASASSGKVTVPDAVDLRPGTAGSLEAWVKPTSTATIMHIMSKSDVVTAREFEFWMTAGGVLNALLGGGTRGGSNAIVLSTVAFNHVVVTWGGGHVIFYVNGVQDTDTAASIGANGATQPVWIGARGDGSQYFNGGFDEPAIYSTALSSARVAAHYAAA